MSVCETNPKKSYFYQKDESYPISNKSLPQLFEEAASREDQNYVTWHRPAERYTYRELYERSQEVAKGLIAAGLKRGDCVMAAGCRGSDGVVMFMAATSIGVIFTCPYLYIPTNKILPAAIQKVQPRLILVGDVTITGDLYAKTFMTLNDWLKDQSEAGNTLPLVYYDSISAESEECMKCSLFAQPLTSLIDRGCSVSDNKLREEISATKFDDPCLYAFTSGSTGEPKTLVLEAIYFTNSTFRENRLQLTKDNVIYGIQNMASDECFLVCDFVAAVKNGYPCVIFPSIEKYTEEEAIQEICECIQQHRISFANAVQRYARQITANSSMREKYDLTSVNGWMLCAAPISESVKSQIINDYPLTVDVYGLTEAYVVSAPTPGYNKKKPNSIGRPLINVEVKVCDDDGNIVDCGKEGGLLVKTPTLFQCYRDQPELTKSMFTEDGWLKTGDCVRMDEEGDLFFVSRLSRGERYKVQYDNVYAAPIEHVLNRNPKIKECAVIGIPSAVRAAELDGEDELCYCIVPKVSDSMTIDEVRSYALENMSHQREWPMRVMFLDKIPRQGARMKVGKLKLIEKLEKEVKEDSALYKSWAVEMNKKRGKICSVPGCSKYESEIRMLRFPTNAEQSKRWVINIRAGHLEKRTINQRHRSCVLCESHFEDSQFLNNSRIERLKYMAVPTLLPSLPNPPKQIALRRKPRKRTLSEELQRSQ